MTEDFSKTTLEYNEGFIDGLRWVLYSGEVEEADNIVCKIEEIIKANNAIIDEVEKHFEQKYGKPQF